MKKLVWFVIICLCVYVGTHPIKYFFADEPIALLSTKSSKLLNDFVYMTSFYIHIFFGGIALLIGWVQFIEKIRLELPKLHRVIGKIYVVSIFISGPVGFYIGFFVQGGILTQIGFIFGAFIWTFITYLAYKAIRKGNVAQHKEFMSYSYVGSFAAVLLRLMLPVLISITGSFKIAYGLSVWLSWIPSTLIVYLLFHKKEQLKRFYKRFYIKKVMMGVIAVVILAFALSYTSPQTWLYKKAAYEGTEFKKATSLEKSIFTKKHLEEFESFLKEESNTTSMIVLENGKVVFEYGDVSEISYNASVRKSILAMLYGKYVTNGTINLNEPIAAIGIDEDDGLLPIEKQATINHVLTARSGVFHVAANDGYDLDNAQQRGSQQPGSYFLYNNWDFNVAGHILAQKTGNTVYEELESQLAVPLGFQDWHIDNQFSSSNTKKSRYAAYHMHLSTRDMAKIGQLMLQKGKWNGTQLISEDWIQKITTPVTPVDTVSKRYNRDVSSPVQLSYGYMWWLYERFYDNPDFEGAYAAHGAFGQFITVIPKRNIVIVHKTTVDVLTLLGWSERSATSDPEYWWLLRSLMLHRKPISSLATQMTTPEMIEFIKNQYDTDSEYAISERLLNEYGQFLAKQGKYEEAIMFYQLNLQLYPLGVYTNRTYNYYGESLVELGKKEEAKKMFKKSLEVYPANTPATKALKNLNR